MHKRKRWYRKGQSLQSPQTFQVDSNVRHRQKTAKFYKAIILQKLIKKKKEMKNHSFDKTNLYQQSNVSTNTNDGFKQQSH